MAIYSKAKKDSLENDLCFVCGQLMPKGRISYWLKYGVRIHTAYAPLERGKAPARSEYPCADRFAALLRDYTHSARGRLRPTRVVLADAYAARCGDEGRIA